MQPAGLRFRFMAMLYDSLIVVAIWILTALVGTMVVQGTITGPIFQSVLFIEWFSFFAYFWVRRGQTVGMAAWRLRIVSEQPMSLMQALVRFLVAGLSILCVGLGYFWIWVDRESRTWHDIVSRTSVVRYPRALS